jgi:hypothetical protein
MTSSPPPTENFETPPVVTAPPYEYDPDEAERMEWRPFKPHTEPEVTHAG